MKMRSALRTVALAIGSAWTVAFVLARPAAPVAAVATTYHEPGELFAHSDNCVACHNNLVTATGEDASIGTTWRSTMMANSGRDPYWQASVRRETLDHPTKSADIQDECATCHMPMLQRTAHASNAKADVFAHLPGNAEASSDLGRLAADGVSCTVCHQIAGETLGTRASFNGNFVMKSPRPDGVREIFGRFAVDPGRRTIMRSVSGFEQVEAPHVKQSELCASCHTLITEAFGPNGQVVGSLPEQMNFQEWQHSAFYQEQKSCQSCHMPRVDGPIRVSSVLGDPRDGLSRHVFVGGNAFMVRMLNRFREELGVEALPSELEATARATERQLERDTATLAVESPTFEGTRLTFNVNVRNLTGHKFPTGYPARRTWLHVTVRDADGRTVFESGGVTSTGAIKGNDNDADAARFEPHYDRIASADDVQIYESILGDVNGRVTTGLLKATQYLKDNRLLPRGFDKATADPMIAVHGAALGDGSFTGGGDRTRYEIDVPAGSRSLEIDVELLFQPIGYRWAHNLDAYDAPEPKRFVGYYKATSSSTSVVVSRSSQRVTSGGQ
jgi:hypothetical protein